MQTKQKIPSEICTHSPTSIVIPDFCKKKNSLQSPFRGNIENTNYLFTVNSSTLSTSASSLSPEQQRLADEHDDGGVTIEPTQRTAIRVSKKKPHRPCIFCGQLKSDITAHLITVHKNEDQIIEIQTMDKRARLQALSKLRKQGIAKRRNWKLL